MKPPSKVVSSAAVETGRLMSTGIRAAHVPFGLPGVVHAAPVFVPQKQLLMLALGSPALLAVGVVQ